MLFVEPRFFLFFVMVFTLYWSLKSNQHRKYVLLVASAVFYGAWDWRFLSLIAFSTVVDYWSARIIENTQETRKRRLLIGTSMAMNLGFLGFFKYFNFFAESFSDLLAVFGMTASYTTLHIILPVGISFYTFQTMSYTIDVYRTKLKAEKSFTDFAFFVIFFPQLVAGPIVRAIDFLPQVHETKRWQDVAVKPLVLLFLLGFIKKACISDNLAFYVDLVFENPQAYTSPSVIVATFLYAIQIYCDFSGYTDMAIACAGLLGYSLCKNFDAPYLSASIVDFWRRWHMSLSTWLRDYLYIPLGGGRHGTLMRYRNLMLTMVLGGLWHGASWNFIVWGGLHGAALSLNHFWRDKTRRRIPAVLGWGLTLWFVALCWIFFRAHDFESALYMVRVFATGQATGMTQLPVTLFVVPFVLLGAHFLWRRNAGEEKIAALPDVVFTGILAVLTALAVSFIPMGYAPFIYFQF